MEKGTWYQRELAVLEEMCDADLVNEQPSQDSDAHHPTHWHKWPGNREKPKVDDIAVLLHQHEENLPSSLCLCVGCEETFPRGSATQRESIFLPTSTEQ